MKALALVFALSATLVSLAGCDNKAKEQAAADQFMKGAPLDETGKGMSITDDKPAHGSKK